MKVLLCVQLIPIDLIIQVFDLGKTPRSCQFVYFCHKIRVAGILAINFISILRYVKETAAQIVSEQSPRKLSEIRSRLYELIVHCIPPEVNTF